MLPYLNVDEVESALSVASAAPNTALTELITLPNLTWEGRQCHAIKIANGSGPGRVAVIFLGGIHAREWGSCDILINFVEQILDAYRTGSGLTFGAKSFAANQIKTIVDTLDIVVFPQANPDGRAYSMATEPWWRKNRKPDASCTTTTPGTGSGPGVDINRNYDWVWKYPIYFSPSAAVVSSTSPCDETYIGPGAASEPETQNVVWLLDNTPATRFFIDLHSYGEDILYSWGDDEDQSTDPSMTFSNPAFDGARGVAGDAYGEYIPSSDKARAITLATSMADAIQAVRGRNYVVEQDFTLYPTSGTSDSYAYSRHFTDTTKSNIFAYTIEWGSSSNVPNPFHPAPTEMQNIIDEITAGLVQFCMDALKAVAVVLERNPIGQIEVDARRETGTLPIQDAFRVVVDGFTAAELGVTDANSQLAVSSSLPPGAMPITCTGNVSDNGDYGSEIQRFTFFYDLNFDAADTAFSFTTESSDVTLSVTAGSAPAAVSASAVLTLIKQPDPFLLHGDPAWLSVDLRLFTVRPGQTWFGATMDPNAAANPRTAATTFIQQVIDNNHLNNSTTPGTAGGQSFDDPAVLSPDEDHSKLYLQPTDAQQVPVFNFALAKVHCIGLSDAPHVRVFFRLRQTQATYAGFDYDPSHPDQPGQYRRATNPSGEPVPLPGIVGSEYVTVPFFAVSRVDATAHSLDQQPTDTPNIHDFPTIGGAEVDHFYGCWIDINQPDLQLPMSLPPNQNGPFDPHDPNPNFQPVPLKQALSRNLHLCLIAEIAFDPTPIPLGKDPSNWDKLAQRNIAWSDSGSAQAVTTFEVRPTPPGQTTGATPDELMIDWGDIPGASAAQIYLPAVNASDVLAMAERMYNSHQLTRVDDHTLGCPTRGVSYIPIPVGGDVHYAGLLSLDLPPGLPKGHVFNIVVRQITNASAPLPPPPPPTPQTRARRARAAVAIPAEISWRQVVGAFQLTIPVRSKDQILPTEERDLSVLRWIAQAIAPTNRWHPVFSRYLHVIAGRVSTFGGDPTLILPSPTGEGVPKHRPPRGEPPKDERRIEFTGKIAGLVFDRFGDFEGFLLDTQDGERFFRSREKHIAQLAEHAWRYRLRITVSAERHSPHTPQTITVHQPPIPLDPH